MIYMSWNLSRHLEVCWELGGCGRTCRGKFFEGVFSLFRAFVKKCIFYLKGNAYALVLKGGGDHLGFFCRFRNRTGSCALHFAKLLVLPLDCL